MIEWLYYMDVHTAAGIGVGIILVHLLFMIWQYVYIRNVYRKTASPEIALNRLRLLNQYVYNIMAVLSLLFLSFLIAFQLFQGLEADDLFLFYGFAVALLVMGPLLLLKQYMASHLIKRIRATEKTRKDALIESVLGIAAFLF